jgi:hypothetical protein
MKTIHLGVVVLSASLAWLMPARGGGPDEDHLPRRSRLPREPHRDAGRHDLCRQSL